MPDGDKFYWGVRGMGSRTFLNLARNVSTALDIVADQAARIVSAALSQDNAWAGLVREFPGLAVAHQSLVGQLVLPAANVAEELVSLYRHHCEEWNRFPPSSWVPSQRKADRK